MRTSPLRLVSIVLAAFTLGSCSYAYDILAVALGGRLAFVVDPKSQNQPTCLRQIDVTAEGAGARPLRMNTYWHESMTYEDDCANRFPLAYGATLKGEHHPDRDMVKAKPLAQNVVYHVTATTGATGYGGGKFVIHDGGLIENLPLRSP